MSDRDTRDTLERLSGGDDLGAALLSSARGDAPRAGARARTAAVLGLGMTAAMGTAALASGGAAKAAGASIAPKAMGASASVAKAATALWIKLLAAGVLTAAVAGGVTMKVRASHAHDDLLSTQRSAVTSSPSTAPPRVAVAASPSPAPLPVEPSTIANAAPESPLPTATPVPVPVPVPEEPARAPRAKSAPSTVSAAATAAAPASTVSTPSVPTETPLTRELRSLDDARSALGRGDPSGALAELDRHDRAFPAGALRTESKVLRAEALLARGDRAAARKLAADLLARDPSGPHARRLRTIADAP